MPSSSQSTDKAATTQMRLTTDSLPTKDRFAIWREIYCRSWFNMSIERVDDGPFRSTVDFLKIDGCVISTIAGSPIRIAVAKEHLATAPDVTTITIMTRGGLRGRSKFGETHVKPGQAFAALNNEVTFVDVLQSSAAFNIALPTAALQARIPDLTHVLMRPLSLNSPSMSLLANYARTVQALSSSLTGSLPGLVSQHLADLASHALSGAASVADQSTSGGIRAARLLAIRQYVAANMTRHDLTSEEVALHLGISPRYMREMLQAEETTFSDILRQTRLRKARQLLSAPRESWMPVSSIAYAVGFNDVSYFNRCFRQQFGMTPSDLRKTLASPTGQD